MRIAIISDIHANFPALRATLAAIRRGGADEVLCLGDLVGYNAMPRETLELLREDGVVSVHGNHDLMAIRRLPAEGCGPNARRAIAWTQQVLTNAERTFLADLPGELRRAAHILCVHSARGDPVVRLTTPDQFSEQARLLGVAFPQVRVCFTGHTHRQHVVEVSPQGEVRTHTGDTVLLPAGTLCFVNPGSVGDLQSRDQRAAYALFDWITGTVRFHRVVYDRGDIVRENVRHGLITGRASAVAPTLLAAWSLACRLLGIAP